MPPLFSLPISFLIKPLRMLVDTVENADKNRSTCRRVYEKLGTEIWI